MRTTLAFIKWIFVKLGEKLAEYNKDFRRNLVNETPLTLFIWLICSIVSSMVVLAILSGLQSMTGIEIPAQVWFGYMWACLFYLIYTAFSIMYTAFKRERAELFETIKNGR